VSLVSQKLVWLITSSEYFCLLQARPEKSSTPGAGISILALKTGVGDQYPDLLEMCMALDVSLSVPAAFIEFYCPFWSREFKAFQSLPYGDVWDNPTFDILGHSY
jgi:hypothetical protein